MCQVAGFRNPCCRRTYVLVSKTPGCPEDWPKTKCPPEYCLQIRQYEPEERTTGVCWRCKADRAGEHGRAREHRIPKIDKAFFAAPLHYSVAERKQHAEAQGHCWYCNAKGSCYSCGSKQIPLKEPPALNRQPDVCWYCNANEYCRSCRRGDILKEEDPISLTFTASNKRSRSSMTGASQSRTNNSNKRFKVESLDSKASVRASVSMRSHYNYHQANAVPHPYYNTPQPYTSPLPSSTVTFRGPSDLSSHGPHEPQGFYPDIPNMSSHGWQPVNQESRAIGGQDNYGHTTEYQSDTGSVNGQYTDLNHLSQQIQQYPDGGLGFPSSDQTPMNVVCD